MVAFLSSRAKAKSEDILALHKCVLNHAADSHLEFVSMRSAGSATDLSGLVKLSKHASRFYEFPTPQYKIFIQVSLISSPPRRLVISENRNTVKNAANQLLSGEHLLYFQRFHINISHLAFLLQTTDSPLY